MNDDAKIAALRGLLLCDGCADHLDAMYALHRFKREVTGTAVAVLKARLPELVSAIGSQGAVGPNDVDRYCDPDGIEAKGWDGSWGWLTGCIRLRAPGCDCHLGLSFERSEVSGSRTPYVTFMSQNFRNAADFEKVSQRSADRTFVIGTAITTMMKGDSQGDSAASFGSSRILWPCKRASKK
jgi:hypothetical protein